MKARLGVAPIAWSNDDLPELGGDTPLATCLAQARAAGYSGIETGGKFPKTAAELGPILAEHGLVLASGWYSGTVLDTSLAEEIDRAQAQIALFTALKAPCLVYGETAGTIQNRRDAPLTTRRTLSCAEIARYARRLTAFADWCADAGMPLAFHHHMGTVIETEEELDTLMAHAGDSVNLIFDTGHMAFAGGDLLRTIGNHGDRIIHVHCKDLRAAVAAGLDRDRESFLDAVLKGAFTVPGDGSLDFPAIARALAAAGFAGWFVVEAEQDPARAPPFQYAQMGRAHLAGCLEAAGYTVVEQ